MFNNINMSSVIKSFFLGLFIGGIIQVFVVGIESMAYFIASVFVSGIVGFFIGLLTELITAGLPVSLAKPKTYFLINNVIALAVATVILWGLSIFFAREMEPGDFTKTLLLILFIIAVANFFDYWDYMRMNKKLNSLKDDQ